MTPLLRKIFGSAMSRTHKINETYRPHSSRSLQNYFVREISGSFDVAKAAALKEISDNNNRSRWSGGKRSRRKRSDMENQVKSCYL
jgi:hypothetical protein